MSHAVGTVGVDVQIALRQAVNSGVRRIDGAARAMRCAHDVDAMKFVKSMSIVSLKSPMGTWLIIDAWLS
jgi:hypothetical protein